jgi:hypothetical protein
MNGAPERCAVLFMGIGLRWEVQMSTRRMGITVGDLFEKTNSTRWTWQVREIFTPSGHRPHARLVRFDYPTEARLFSLSALADRRLFVRAGASAADRTNAPSESARNGIISNAEWQHFREKTG